MKVQWTGYAFVAASAIGFGFMPIFATLAYGAGMSVHTVLFLRFVCAALLMVPLAVADIRRHRGNLTRRAVVSALLMGTVLYTGQALGYFFAVKFAGASLAALLLYLYPGLVAAAECVIHRRRPHPLLIAAVVVSFVGIALSLGPLDGTVNLLGVALGILAALFYVVYILVGSRVSAGMPPFLLTQLVFVGAIVGLGSTGLASGQIRFDFAPVGWLWVVLIAVVCTIVGILFFFMGMVKVGPTRASIGSTLEPVTSLAMASLILGSVMTPWQIVGAVLVLIAAIAGVVFAPTSAKLQRLD